MPRSKLFSTRPHGKPLLTHPSSPLELRLSNWFGPYVQSWLEETDSKTLGWVDKAISVDNVSWSRLRMGDVLISDPLHFQFEAEGIDRHSSSIVDLISSCQAAVRFIQDDLKWPDEVENAIFLTKLSRVRGSLSPFVFARPD